MFDKEKLKGILVITFFIILVIVMIIAFLYLGWRRIQPTQTAHVTVVSKRTAVARVPGSGGGRTYKTPDCFVVFRFSDGSEKELFVNPGGGNKRELGYEFFQELQEGDTGILSYKELKSATDWGQRTYISFEKDEQ